MACAVPASGAARAKAPGFFTVTQAKGKWWLIPPGGAKFISMGINCVGPSDWSPIADSPKYRGGELRGGTEKWAAFTASRLRDWGFNTIAGWSDRSMWKQGMPYCVSLHLAAGNGHRLIDVWDPAYAERVGKALSEQAEGVSPNDPLLIGYFLDNEVPWYGEAGWPTGGKSLLEMYLKLPEEAPGRREAMAFMAGKAGEPADGNIGEASPAGEKKVGQGGPAGKLSFEAGMALMGKPGTADEFAGLVAARFMETAVSAVRKRDPNHLILGMRFANGAPDAVVRAVGAKTDVLTLNWYVKSGSPDPNFVDRFYLLSGKPVMITEYSYRAMENRTGTRNSRGADVTVQTQADRAIRYRRYVETLGALPEVVGFHWFQYSDQPTAGRFDGEDCNYGLVDHNDEPYEELLAAMRDLNGRIVKLHGESPLKLPASLDERRPLPPAKVARAGNAGLARGRFKPVTFVDYSRTMPGGKTWGDDSSGCAGKLEAVGGKAVFSYNAGPGWGCGADLMPEGGVTVNALGARRMVLRMKVPAGVRYIASINEDGAGPADAPSFTSPSGADGEQYLSPELVGSGRPADIRVELSDMRKGTGYGNQAGNETVDTQGMKTLGIHVGGGQGPGDIEIEWIRFE